MELSGGARQLQVAPNSPGGHDSRVLDEGNARGAEAAASGRRGRLLGIAHQFSQGHLVLKSGETANVARCGMIIVEVRNQTVCTQEIPVTFKGEEAYVEPLSLVLQSSATLVSCRREAPPHGG